MDGGIKRCHLRVQSQVRLPPGMNAVLVPAMHVRPGESPARMLHTKCMVFELRHLNSGTLVHSYMTEGAALAFVRDVIRIAGRDRAAGFTLEERDERGDVRALASGEKLVRRALEDRAE